MTQSEAPIAWGLGLLFSAAVTGLIWKLSPRLDRFPKGEKGGTLWYKWKSPPRPELVAFSPATGIKQCPCPTFQAKSAWLCYAAHQAFAWAAIYLMQYHLSGPSADPFAFNGTASSCVYNTTTHETPECGYADMLHWTQWLALLGHAAFILLHLLQTHVWYDGTALDMGENTSQISVVFMLVFVLFMENHERGLFFGARLPIEEVISAFALKYHGYLFSWATIYTFWYHPCEGTPRFTCDLGEGYLRRRALFAQVPRGTSLASSTRT